MLPLIEVSAKGYRLLDVPILDRTVALAWGKMASMNGETNPFPDENSYASI